MPQELPHLCYNSKSIQRTLEQSLDWRVQSWKRSPSYLWRRWRSQSSHQRVYWVRCWGGRVHDSVGDCWKGLRIGSTCHDLYFSLFIFPLLFYQFSYFPHCFSTISLCLASHGHCACFFIPFIPIELTLH